MSHAEGKRVKRWAPKVFSGCLTCKRRRIKCDETKPACLRCGRSNLQCEGYAPPQPRIFEPNKKGESSSRSKSVQQNRRPSATSSASSSPPTVLSRLELTADEQHSYDVYLRETAPACSVFSRRYFWTVLVPQAALAHPAVKHSLLSMAIIWEMVMYPARASALEDERLLYHYNAAIRAITHGHPTTDIVLITSVLFFFIDFLRRDGAQVPAHHVEAAVNILEEFKTSESRAGVPYRETIINHIEPLVQAFWGWVSLQSAIVGAVPLSTTEAALHSGLGTPAVATAQIRETTETLLRILRTPEQLGDVASELEQLRAQILLSQGMLSTYRAARHGQQLSGRMFMVHHAFAITLLREVKEHLKIPETLYDDGILALYDFMVDHLEMYLSENQTTTTPAPTTDPVVPDPWKDLGYIAPLFTTIIRSPDDDLADRALKLLRELHVTEGRWTSGLAADIAEALAQAEVQDTVGFDLSGLCFERKPGSGVLRIYATAEDVAVCDHYLPLPAGELDGMDVDAILGVVQCYGYQSDRACAPG